MQRLEVSAAVRHIYMSLGFKRLMLHDWYSSYETFESWMIQQVNNTDLNIIINFIGLCLLVENHSFVQFGFEVFKIVTNFHGGCFSNYGSPTCHTDTLYMSGLTIFTLVVALKEAVYVTMNTVFPFRISD